MNDLQTRPTIVSVPEGAFDLANDNAYQAWRMQKLASLPRALADLMVEIKDGTNVSRQEREAILECCQRCNMAIYQLADGDFSDKEVIRKLAEQFGLKRFDKNLRADEDAISSLRVANSKQSREYIPYTDRPINWHTDGYYNPLDQQVRGVVMHCVTPAADGGENRLLDHEMVYLQMRDQKPECIEALMQPDVMTIPANTEDGIEIRGAQTGPVFSVDPASGRLHMRYTARKRSISWKDNAVTDAAVELLSALINKDSPYAFRIALKPGQGIICNNVLHGREYFQDGGESGLQRLLYRARYYDGVNA